MVNTPYPRQTPQFSEHKWHHVLVFPRLGLEGVMSTFEYGVKKPSQTFLKPRRGTTTGRRFYFTVKITTALSTWLIKEPAALKHSNWPYHHPAFEEVPCQFFLFYFVLFFETESLSIVLAILKEFHLPFSASWVMGLMAYLTMPSLSLPFSKKSHK